MAACDIQVMALAGRGDNNSMIGDLIEGLGDLGAPALVVGAVVVAAPTAARLLRPLVKGAIKGYLALADGTRAVAERAQTAAVDARQNVREVVSEAPAGSAVA